MKTKHQTIVQTFTQTVSVSKIDNFFSTSFLGFSVVFVTNFNKFLSDFMFLFEPFSKHIDLIFYVETFFCISFFGFFAVFFFKIKTIENKLR